MFGMFASSLFDSLKINAPGNKGAGWSSRCGPRGYAVAVIGLLIHEDRSAIVT